MSEYHKYLLGIRNIDYSHKKDSVGPGEMYRKKFGNKREIYEKKNPWLIQQKIHLNQMKKKKFSNVFEKTDM